MTAKGYKDAAYLRKLKQAPAVLMLRSSVQAVIRRALVLQTAASLPAAPFLGIPGAVSMVTVAGCYESLAKLLKSAHLTQRGAVAASRLASVLNAV